MAGWPGAQRPRPPVRHHPGGGRGRAVGDRGAWPRRATAITATGSSHVLGCGTPPDRRLSCCRDGPSRGAGGGDGSPGTHWNHRGQPIRNHRRWPPLAGPGRIPGGAPPRARRLEAGPESPYAALPQRARENQSPHAAGVADGAAMGPVRVVGRLCRGGVQRPDPAMILYLPAALFLVSLLMAYGSAGRRRQAATIGALAAAAWSLALLVDPGSVAWAIGPMVASLLLARTGKRLNSSFEGLTRRVATIGAALLVALLLAARLPVGENPLLLSAVPWFLGALGAAWFASPIDQPERLQGQVLMVAAAAAVILAAVPAGPVTASLAGAMALVPLAGDRWRLPGRLQLPFSLTLLALAIVAVVVAGIGPSIARIVLFDFSVDVSGVILLAIAVLLAAGAALTPIGSGWAALPGVLGVRATAPGLRLAALGGVAAFAPVLAKEG